MKRIVYTFATGKPIYGEYAMGLGRSLKLIGDETTRVVVTNLDQFPWEECFHEVLRPPEDETFEWLFFNKLNALDRTDADQVLFIDADHLAFKKLDGIFEYCEGKGLCVQGSLQRDGFWHIDIAKHCAEFGLEGLPRFNGGMIYYERTDDCRRLIKKCFEVGREAKRFGFYRTDMPANDEIGISIAMAHTGLGHTIPHAKDFHSSATGLVGKLRMDVRTNTCSFISRHTELRFVQPYLFHASRYKNFLIFWRQLDALKRLANYEKRHGFGYMSPWQRIQRSIQRRILKLKGRA